MTLDKYRREIAKLVEYRGWMNEKKYVIVKMFSAVREVSEAFEAWKKRKGEEEIAEELIDAIFFILDTARLLCPDVSLDDIFIKKLKENYERKGVKRDQDFYTPEGFESYVKETYDLRQFGFKE